MSLKIVFSILHDIFFFLKDIKHFVVACLVCDKWISLDNTMELRHRSPYDHLVITTTCFVSRTKAQ